MLNNPIISVMGLALSVMTGSANGTTMTHSSGANEACAASLISLDPVSAQSTYDVFSTATSPLVKGYQVRADVMGQNCSIVVEIDVDDGSTVLRGSSQQALRFEWAGGNGYQKGGRWYVTLTDATPNVQFQLRFPSEQWATAGQFNGQMTASIQPNNSNEPISEEEVFLEAEVDVLPSAKIQFYGLSQRHYDLDLGKLDSHKVIQSAPNLWVQSTGEYAISIESENRGYLRHESLNTQWNVAYDFLINNQEISLVNTSKQWRSSHATQGKALPMAFVIGDISQRPGGDYSDILHITIEPELSQTP